MTQPALPTESVQEASQEPQATTEPPEPAQELSEQEETFDRQYVEKLRKESADARVKAKRVDELSIDRDGRFH